MATYPSNPSIPAGTSATELNSTNWNVLVDNIEAIADDLIDGRSDDEAWPVGTPHTAAQATDIDNSLDIIRHMIQHISGETHYYDAPAASLKSHDHSDVTKGGRIPYASIGDVNERLIDLHPQYSGGVQTNSLRGSSASGSNTITITNGVEVVSYAGRHFYNGVSAQVSLNDTYIAIRFTIPKDFTAWKTSGALTIEYKSDSVLYTDCHVDSYIFKSGISGVIASSENNVNTSWSLISFTSTTLGAWSAGDVMELYLKLESKNNNNVKVGKVSINYTS